MLVAVMRLFRHPLFDTDMIRRVGGAPTVIPSLMHYTTHWSGCCGPRDGGVRCRGQLRFARAVIDLQKQRSADEHPDRETPIDPQDERPDSAQIGA
jgi:hypothetical protein